MAAAFIVVRSYGRARNRDFLCGWSERWGGVTSLSRARARRFANREEAQAVASRAACMTMGSVFGEFSWSVAPAEAHQ